ncbi:hypothetical protein N658DRAFT_436629 [Parathielavia hyrcaniae]|uniref:Transcriptional regulator n=1 Tax=Parathielavia hyrcaniae TaxID=113614 RepID=A0AAN6PQP5_9PEZI|nr:hypothetical protein N658DRAFT_436629 [Parathielavia hyrcaniae]
MAPTKATDKAIEKVLADVVRKVYNGPKRDQLTVNYVRQTAEDSLKLGGGFLKEGDWKARSKQIILDTLEKLEAGDTEPSQQAPPTPKTKAKPAPKQGKKRAQKAALSDDGSAASDASEAEDAPQPLPKKRRVTKSQVKRKAVSSDEDLSDASLQEFTEPLAKRRSKQPAESESDLSDVPDHSSESQSTPEEDEAPKPASDDESELSEVMDEPPKRKPKSKAKGESSPPPTEASNTKPAADDSSSELSSVIDDPPPPKRKRKGAKDAAGPAKSTAARGGGGGAKSASSTDSPDEAQIKLLQSQLSKCGVRKVWAFEFKKHGADTAKAKIRHLRDALAEVGMTGRFSEARAREIKEMRELQADLQDVMQGEKSWGVGGGGRGARRRAAAGSGGDATAKKGKRSKEEESEDEDDDEEEEGKNGDGGGEESDVDDDDDGGGKPAVRGKGPARRRPELAFLGDESESE